MRRRAGSLSSAVDPAGSELYGNRLARSDGSGPGGGIGRRAGFRCQWLNGREGSSPFLGTIGWIARFLAAGAGTRHIPDTHFRSRFSSLYWADETHPSERAKPVTTFLHDGDLPADALAGASAVAIDSETMGLRLGRDPLCVVQLSDGNGDAHVVQLDRSNYDAPNLKRLLTDPAVTKIFHYGRFDIAMFWLHLGVVTAPVYCTKIASKLARTYTDRHGLKDVSKELLGVDMSKAQQSSDWGSVKLSEDQLAYAASDVLHLHALRTRLDEMLVREGRDHLAKA